MTFNALAIKAGLNLYGTPTRAQVRRLNHQAKRIMMAHPDPELMAQRATYRATLRRLDDLKAGRF